MVSIVHAARDIGRLREVATVLARHGFGEVVARLGLSRRKKERRDGDDGPEILDATFEEEAARGAREKRDGSRPVRIRRVLEDLGPSFVKLGQIASTRPDLLPPDVIAELKKLQDSVVPVPFERIKEQVE